jgi:UDP-glucose 4-epimerase
LKILITGGAGFIGSHLAEHLVYEGHQVSILDNLSSGKIGNLGPFPYTDKSLVRIADCQNKQSLKEAADGCDYIYHAASTVGVQKVLRDPAAAIQNILDSTRAVLELGIPGMYFSTSEVYGTSREIQSEDSRCVISGAPRWSYAAAKLIGEWWALDEKWQVIRLFNVIGPRQNPAYGAVFPNFVNRALEGKPLEVYGDGSQVRTFTSVHDVVKILDVLRWKSFDVVNVGGNQVYEINHLAQMVVTQIEESSSGVNYIPYEKAYGPGFEECPSRIPDLTKLRSLIGDFKFTPLHQMIEEMAQETSNARTTVCK